MNRREAMNSLLVGPLAAVGVTKAVEIPANCKLLILSFESHAILDREGTRKSVQNILDRAGMGHVEFLLAQGLESVGVVT